MKRLVYFSQASTKVFIIFCWFLLSPYSLLTAEAVAQESEILLEEANTTDSADDDDIDSTSKTDTVGSKITHSLDFDRASIAGKRMRLRGIYAEGTLGFTRPLSWDVENVKALIRFQHSTALDGKRSNLAVFVNDTAVGSIPLNRQQSQTGQLLVNIPSKLLKDYNEVKLIAQQRNYEICVDPYDPSLWTQIQPDSKIIFDYKLKKLLITSVIILIRLLMNWI